MTGGVAVEREEARLRLAREFLEQAARGASCEVLSEVLRRAREQRTIDESVGP